MNIKRIIVALLAVFVLTSCDETPTGSVSIAYDPYNGGIDPEVVYSEGTHVGISWVWKDLINYDARQRTIKLENQSVLDKNGVPITVSAEVYYRVVKSKIGYLHLEKGTDYEETYATPMAASALKNIIGRYDYIEITSTKREHIQNEIKDILVKVYSKNYLQCDDVTVSSVKLPAEINKAIISKQTQDEANKLAEKKKEEQDELGKARIAKAEADLRVAELDAKAKELLSQPKMLELLRLENERLMWEGFKNHGKSPFGNSNMFGITPSIFKNFKD